MTWTYKKKEVTEISEDYLGFVYLITNVVSGRKYIGKKLAKFAKTTYKTVTLKNGKKKKKKILVFRTCRLQIAEKISVDIKEFFIFIFLVGFFL